jgi:tetratricopeptide (TPR) repeat protein
MNNKTEIEGDKNINLQNISNSPIYINSHKSDDDKKSSSVQKFFPKNFPQSLIYFTGREQVLENIAEALKNHGTAAFADTHGVGKSSVVIEFAYRNEGNYRKILFIRATNNEFNIYVSDVLKDLGFALPEDAKPEERLAVLQKWLAENQDWLLLVDNVDDVDFIHQCGFNKPNGKVIYTSNDDKIFRFVTRVELPKMNDDNAILLLYKHWKDKPDAKLEDIPENSYQALKGIAEKFGNHPFSMAFVGSYLAEEDESLEEFLEEYQSKEKNLLQNYEFLTDYHQKNVATAFLFRFEQISTPKDDTEREQFLSIAVKDYLKLSAFVGTDNIPEELLQQSLAKLHPDQSEWTENRGFIKDIYKRFKPTSIFKRDAENKTLSTHRIVLEIMRFQIKDEEDIILETLAEVLDDNFEAFNFTNKEKVERYLIHVGIFLEYLEQSKAKDKVNLKLENELIAFLCNKYAQYFYHYGQYKKAEKYYELFKDICKEIKDIDQTLLAMSYNNLAQLYREQSRFKEAEPLQKRALEINEKVLGENHLSVAMYYNNLAALYDSQSRYEEAEPLYKKALEIREKILGENHSSTAMNYNNLATLYQSLNRYEEAESLLKKVISVWGKELGENHPNTAISYNNLAGLYFNIGNLKLAKEYQQKSLKSFSSNFGENHPNVAGSYGWLGGIYFREKNYQEALDNFYLARKIYLRFFSKDDPRVIDLQSWIDNIKPLVENSSKIKNKKRKLKRRK